MNKFSKVVLMSCLSVIAMPIVFSQVHASTSQERKAAYEAIRAQKAAAEEARKVVKEREKQLENSRRNLKKYSNSSAVSTTQLLREQMKESQAQLEKSRNELRGQHTILDQKIQEKNAVVNQPKSSEPGAEIPNAVGMPGSEGSGAADGSGE